ncbi:aromatic ring-hydroxylating dioxygenase subunit alpha [Burkholderia sp. Bp9140]|uniref:aromatic ring-hydroxylating dioxygenase subunit alpha n=1 Tax=Burkholderia sp. Bp9140 TaxID=2184572 RepID=UPI001629FB4C|nr:aromatic ring-hydroxylating dioxygenase subunit alpha [Burkholderia sp. Bp9140]
MATDEIFIRNIWYVAAHSEEVTEQPLGRTYLNEPVVLYRTEGGDVVALDDRCPHRFAPLHRGKVVGDFIRCPYHGLQFDRSGACVQMPLGGVAPPRACVRRYPITERYGFIWIWMGEESRADPDLIPDFSDRCDPQIGWFNGTLYCRANYQLLIDNLLDLTHAEFLHPFLSSDGWAGRNKQTVTQNNGEITIVNVAEEDNILPIMRRFKPQMGAIGTTIQTERWNAPGLIRLSVDFWCGGDSIIIPSAHMVTPETATTTHYFVRGGQTLDPENAELTEANRIGVLAVFQNEDIPMLEAQQRYLGERDLMDSHPAVLPSDHGAVRARRAIAGLIRKEREGKMHAQSHGAFGDGANPHNRAI